MIGENRNIIKGLHVILHVITTSITFVLAYAIRNYFAVSEKLSPLFGFDEYVMTMIVACMLWPITFSIFKLYGLQEKSKKIIGFVKKTIASGTGVILIITILFFQRDTDISRSFLIVFFVLNILTIITVDEIFEYVVRKTLKNKRYKKRILIIVSDTLQEQLIKNIKMDQFYSIEIVKIITIKKEEKAINLAELLAKEIVDEVLLGVNKEDSIRLEEYIICCETMGITSNIAISSYELPRGSAKFGRLGIVPVLRYATTPQDQTQLFIKRMIDIVGAGIGLIFTSIVAIIIIPIIKIESSGPVFFKQQRVGKNGRRFKLYKFRSMCVGAEDMKKSLEERNEMQGAMFKIENDPRITKAGKFIRKTSIDELPQFWNVFKGDLSLVGTRPPTIDEVENYKEHHWKRLSMKPGLTGIWQTSGRNKIMDFEQIVKLDVEYIDNWSLGLDMKLIIKTIRVVLFGYGAC